MDSSNPASSPELDSVVDPQVGTILRCLAPEEIDMLRDAFIYMDKDSDGFVSLDEMMAKVEACVAAERFGPLQEYLTPLFLVADKDGDRKLSLTEFLMSFADGPGVVPADVVNECVAAVRVRLTDEEISALQENFRSMDLNGDGYLDAGELEVALRKHLEPRFPDLSDSQYKEIVTVIMCSADADRDGKLCLSEFIRSFQEDQGVLPASFVDPSFSGGYNGDEAATPATRELTETEANVLREAFAVLDKNDDGYIDFVDLYNALWESLSGQVEDKTQIKDLCDLIMATADRRKSGRLSLSEFMLGFLRNMEVMQIPVAVAQEKVRSACTKLQQMYESGELERLVTVFEDLDRNGDGFIDRPEMVNVLTSIFRDAFPEWDDDTLNSVMAAIVTGAESHTSGRISLEEFIRSFVDGAGILPPEAVRVLDDRATAARSRQRPSTASDDDLRRISDALRSLNECADDDGFITEDNLRRGIHEAFADQEEAHPGKAEAMVQYVLSRFVNVVEDGRLAWNENVQIEEDDDEDNATAEGEDAAVCDPIHVPSAQEQELTSPAAVADDDNDEDEQDDVEFTNRDGDGKPEEAKQEQVQAGQEQEQEQETTGAEEERPHSSAGRRRRVVRAASIDMTPVRTSAYQITPPDALLFDDVAPQKEATAVISQMQPKADAVATEGSAASAVCEDYDAVSATQALDGGDANPVSTVPAMVDFTAAAAEPSSALLNCNKKATGSRSAGSKGALTTTTKHDAVLASFKYGATMNGSHDTGSIFEEELRALFRKYDTAKLGCLDRDQFKKVYCQMENFGLEPSQAEVDRQFTKYAKGSSKIFFDEFCVLMLQRVQL